MEPCTPSFFSSEADELPIFKFSTPLCPDREKNMNDLTGMINYSYYRHIKSIIILN